MRGRMRKSRLRVLGVDRLWDRLEYSSVSYKGNQYYQSKTKDLRVNREEDMKTTPNGSTGKTAEKSQKSQQFGWERKKDGRVKGCHCTSLPEANFMKVLLRELAVSESCRSHLFHSGEGTMGSLGKKYVPDAITNMWPAEEKYKKDGYSEKWTFFNDLEFVLWLPITAFSNYVTYMGDLQAALKALFIRLFEPFLVTFVASLHAIKAENSCQPKLAKDGTVQKHLKAWIVSSTSSSRDLKTKLLSLQEQKSRYRPVAPALPDSCLPSDDLSTDCGWGGQRGGRDVTRVDLGSGLDSGQHASFRLQVNKLEDKRQGAVEMG
ncbi:hypothetical protein EDB19DRAFT_2028985 [Suillus lakei]|nr:hypothetical protein EDB19DRAFT_2028985 [Suillus lakei]